MTLCTYEAKFAKMLKIVLVLLTVGTLVSIWYTYRVPFVETQCADIPQGSIVFAPAFLNLGDQDGRIIPGQANVQIANKLEECADRFSLVLTQKAVSDALVDPKALQNGVPVFQMHEHNPSVEVRTLAAFKCALQRFQYEPETVVLLAHPRHHSRALMDLRAVYSGNVVNLRLGNVLYQDDQWWRPWQWTAKDITGWLADGALILSVKYPELAKMKPVLDRINVTADCPAQVQLPKIVQKNGKWIAEPD
jgi:hypothetical protein